jgi:hypothetical protein
MQLSLEDNLINTLEGKLIFLILRISRFKKFNGVIFGKQ